MSTFGCAPLHHQHLPQQKYRRRRRCALPSQLTPFEDSRTRAPFLCPNERADEGEGAVLFAARVPPAIEGLDSAQRRGVCFARGRAGLGCGRIR